MKINIDVSYPIGEIVYLITDPDQYRRMVTGYVVEHGYARYLLSLGEMTTEHYDYEITKDKQLQL